MKTFRSCGEVLRLSYKVLALFFIFTPLHAKDLYWELKVKDIFGNVIDKEKMIGKISIVNFSTKSGQEKAEEIGQAIGSEFGHLDAYQSVVIPNTTVLPFFAKPFAPSLIESAQKKAVEHALQRQKDRGNKDAKYDEVKARITFIHDEDGTIWKYFNLDIENHDLYIGIVDKEAKLVYVTPQINIAEIKTRISELFSQKQN